MKRVIAFLIVFFSVLSAAAPAFASGNDIRLARFYLNGGVEEERVIVHDGRIYLPGESYSKYTSYSYKSDGDVFVGPGSSSGITVPGVITEDGVDYYPINSSFPALGAEIAATDGGAIIVVRSAVSIREILKNDYSGYIVGKKEVMTGLGTSEVKAEIAGYVYDTFLRDRIDVLEAGGSENGTGSYSGAFKMLLTPDGFVSDIAKDPKQFIETARNNAEPAGSKATLFDTILYLTEENKAAFSAHFDNAYNPYGIRNNYIDDLSGSENSLAFSEYTYFLAIYLTDEIEAFETVLGSKDPEKEGNAADLSANEVISEFKDNIVPNVGKDVGSSDSTDEIVKKTVGAVRAGLDDAFPDAPSDEDTVRILSDLADRAFYRFNSAPDENVTEKRASLILALKAGKICCDLISERSAGSEIAKSFGEKSEKIGDLLKTLLLAGDSISLELGLNNNKREETAAGILTAEFISGLERPLITADEAQARAKTVIDKYVLYASLGTACDFSLIDADDPFRSTGNKGNYGNFCKVTCCKTVEEARAHVRSLFAPEFCTAEEPVYVEYNGALYVDIKPTDFPMATVTVTGYDRDVINAEVVFSREESGPLEIAVLEFNGEDYVLKSLELKESPPEPVSTPEPTHTNPYSSPKDMIPDIVDHYMQLWQPQGRYAISEHEMYTSGDYYCFVLRYQMCDAEADAYFERGSFPPANVLVGDIRVNMNTGETSIRLPGGEYEDFWYLW